MVRIKTAFNKLIFCLNITANISSFILLVWNTKKYKWSKNNFKKRSLNESPVKYTLRFNKQRQIIYLRTYSGDIDIFYEIFWKKVYSFSSTGTPRFIIDIGANVGLATLYFLKEFPGCKIICVEPDPANVETLKKNLELQIKKQQVKVYEAAISNNDGNMFLNSPQLKYNSKLLADDNNDEMNLSVKVLSMNNFLKENSIEQTDILKIDIEGSEVELFSADVSWLSIVKEVVIETHSITAEEICSKAFKENQFVLQDHTANIFHWIK